MTNFECVKQFHQIFGHPVHETIQKNLAIENPKLCNFRLDLIQEEFNELKQAVSENNIVEITDALADILYVVYGMGHVFGINLDKAFRIVHDSNMSKMCWNENEAVETIKYYETLKEFADRKITYRPDPSGKYYVVYDTESGKILKSKYYKQVDFGDMFKE